MRLVKSPTRRLAVKRGPAARRHVLSICENLPVGEAKVKPRRDVSDWKRNPFRSGGKFFEQCFDQVDLGVIDASAHPLDLAFEAHRPSDHPPVFMGFTKRGGRIVIDILGRWAGQLESRAIVLDLGSPQLEERLHALKEALSGRAICMWNIQPFFAAMVECLDACEGRVTHMHLWGVFSGISNFCDLLGFDIDAAAAPLKLDAEAVRVLYGEAAGIPSPMNAPSQALCAALMKGHVIDIMLTQSKKTPPTTDIMTLVLGAAGGLAAREEAKAIESSLGPTNSADGATERAAGRQRSTSL